MCWAQIVGMATQGGQGILQGQQQADTATYNANVFDMKAADAIARGNQAAAIQHNKGEQILGAQRAATGASGVEIGTGSNAKVLDQTATMSALDEATIRVNAAREAWGFTNEAENQRAQALAAGAMQRALIPGAEDGFMGIPKTASKYGVPFNFGNYGRYVQTGQRTKSLLY